MSIENRKIIILVYICLTVVVLLIQANMIIYVNAKQPKANQHDTNKEIARKVGVYRDAVAKNN